MYLGGIVGIIVVLLSVLIMLGVIGLSNQIVGGMFLAIAIGLMGPLVDKYGRPVA